MTSLTWRWYFSRYGRGDTRNKAENNYQEITMELAHTFLASWWVPYSFWQKICEKHRPRMTDRMILLYLNSWSQSYKGNDMNCCCVEKSSEFRHRTWYKTKRNCWSSSFRFASSFFIGYHIRHLFKYLSTLKNITTLCFPHICINSPLKAYFDYIKKPFVTINNIFIIGPCCCPWSVTKSVAT